MLTGPLIELNSETFIAVKAHHSVGARFCDPSPDIRDEESTLLFGCEIGIGVAPGKLMPIGDGRRMALVRDFG